MYKGAYRILKNLITACDSAYVIGKIKHSVDSKKVLLISPIASQTLVRAYYQPSLQKTLERFDFLLPDSQWVKRSLYFLYNIRLKHRLYGPELMQNVCELAAHNNYRIFLYGSTETTLRSLQHNLQQLFPEIQIASEPSLFRALSEKEQDKLIKRIKKYNPDIIFVGIGSPRQEEFTVWLSQRISPGVPAVIIPAGAAFDFIAKTKPQAPKLLGDLGFEWLFRLATEPKRLWRRYLIDGILFVYLIITQKIYSMWHR